MSTETKYDKDAFDKFREENPGWSSWTPFEIAHRFATWGIEQNVPPVVKYTAKVSFPELREEAKKLRRAVKRSLGKRKLVVLQKFDGTWAEFHSEMGVHVYRIPEYRWVDMGRPTKLTIVVPK